jgi:DNA-binding MarR family transcriptional regulator
MEVLRPAGDAFTDLVLEVFRVNRLLLDAGDRLTEPVGLTSARWQVLGVVEHGPIAVAHVARTIGLTRQSVLQTADGLAEEGLIEYIDNPHHRRAKLMTLTPKGRRALDYVAARHAQWANRLGEAQALEAIQGAVQLLRDIRHNLEHDASAEDDEDRGHENIHR